MTGKPAGSPPGKGDESFWAAAPAPPPEQGRKAGAAPLPFASLAKKSTGSGIPLFKGAGLPSRLKNLKSKEIAFIVAGLSVLILAPIAEHMISSPDEEDGFLVQGFDQKGSGFLPGGANPYEPGIAGIAAGDLPGRGVEVVTPLNVRDPASLIMSPGGEEKKAPAQAEAPAPPPAAPSDGWKDAIRAAQKGVSKATEKVRLPMPNVKLAKMGGLGAPSGNTGANLSLAAPSSKGLFSNPGMGNRVHVTAGPGYRGADRRSLSGGTGAPGLFGGARPGPGGPGGVTTWDGGPGGPASGGSSAGGGSPASSEGDKSGGGGGHSGDKNVGVNQKEDLAWLRRKMEMEKAVGLKWDKKKYDQLERKKMLEELAAQTAQQAFMKILDKLLGNSKGGGDAKAGGGDAKKDDGGAGDPGAQGPATGGAPGEANRPPAQGISADFSQDLALLQSVEKQVREAVARMTGTPPAAPGPVGSAESIRSKAERIAEADARLGQAIEEMAGLVSPAPKPMNPTLEGYPPISSSDPEVRKQLEKQKEEMLILTKTNAQYAGALKDISDGMLKGRDGFRVSRGMVQTAFLSTERSVLEAKARAQEAKAAVEAASKGPSGETVRKAGEAGDRLAAAVARARKAQSASDAGYAAFASISSKISQLQQLGARGDSLLSASAAKLDTTAEDLLKTENGFNEKIAPLLRAEAAAARENSALFKPSREAATKGVQAAAEASAAYGSIAGAAR